MELMRRAIQTDPSTLKTHIHIYLLYWNKTSRYKKSVGGHKDEIRACVLFEPIPMGNWAQMKHGDRSGDLYLWWCGFQPGHWVRTPIVCELLHTPLDISSAGTSGALPSSWCWWGGGGGGGTADKTTQQNPPMQMTQNGSTLNKHKYTL